MKYVVVILVALVMSACSTVAGVGKDITNTAEWTKDKISGK